MGMVQAAAEVLAMVVEKRKARLLDMAMRQAWEMGEGQAKDAMMPYRVLGFVRQAKGTDGGVA